MQESIEKELDKYYSFHPLTEKRPSILLIKTRRKDDPCGSYVPVADLNDSEMKKVWNDLEIGSCCFDESYVRDCLFFDYPPEKALLNYDTKSPLLQNTVFIKYKKSEVSESTLYGVFLIHRDSEDVVITELYRMSVRRNAKKSNPSIDGILTSEALVFIGVRFERYRDGDVEYYAYSLNFRSSKTGKDHICMIVTNIAITAKM